MTYASRTLSALADPTRRAIFERLATGPQAVGELAQGLPVSRPAVSQHLAVLKAAGLVRERAAGTRRIYRIESAGLGPLRDWLDRFWDQTLQAFKEEAEASPSIPQRKEEP
jgi:DNA-binding transcriptional ArsR family regulator